MSDQGLGFLKRLVCSDTPNLEQVPWEVKLVEKVFDVVRRWSPQ